MVRCPGLTSLTVEALKLGSISIGRLILRPPACALTQVCIRYVCISDKDLFYLTASSTHTLAQVTLDRIHGFTHNGLLTFLDAISENVISPTIRPRGVVLSSRQKRPTGHVLDAVVVKVRSLQVLSIYGEIAGERMFCRRPDVSVRSSCGSGDMPVIRLSSWARPGDQKVLGWLGVAWVADGQVSRLQGLKI